MILLIGNLSFYFTQQTVLTALYNHPFNPTNMQTITFKLVYNCSIFVIVIVIIVFIIIVLDYYLSITCTYTLFILSCTLLYYYITVHMYSNTIILCFI